MLNRGYVKPLAFALIFALGIAILLYQFPTRLAPLVQRAHEKSVVDAPSHHIPNKVHVVFLLEDPKADFPFQFFHYLSLYSAWYHLRPSHIYFHTNARREQIERARGGDAGKWSRLILEMPGLVIKHVKMPESAGNKVKLVHIAHKSDFVRVPAVRDLGGLYIDMDVFILRDLKPLRESGFQAVAGLEIHNVINSGIFLARRQSKFVTQWAAEMHAAYDQGWVTHSNTLMTRIGEALMPQPRELLVMEERTFSPITYLSGAIEGFLETHDDAPLPSDGLAPGGRLPALEYYDSGSEPWAHGLNHSYAIHAFRIEEIDAEVSPRSVLARRSGFARALYPLVREMYHNGIVAIDEH